jgi:hypothetical protein
VQRGRGGQLNCAEVMKNVVVDIGRPFGQPTKCGDGLEGTYPDARRRSRQLLSEGRLTTEAKFV